MTQRDDEENKLSNLMPAGLDIGEETPSSELADVHTLLGSRENRRYVEWEDRGHSDPTLLAGRPLSSYIHVIALCLAAVADVGAFLQVVELVLPTYSEGLVIAVVCGFTAVVLYTAHSCGVLFRDRKAGASWINGMLPYTCVLIWLGLGVAAFEVRLLVLGVSPALSLSLSAGGTQSQATSSIRYGSATLFLALYLATGLVAGVGAYITHNPLLNSYASAARAYDKAVARLAASTFQAHMAEGECRSYRAELAAAEKVLQHEVQIRIALAAKLRRFTGVQVAQPSHAPTITDTMPNKD